MPTDRRGGRGSDHAPGRSDDDGEGSDGPDPIRVVPDADVLAADLLVGGPPREAMDVLRAHSWLQPVATDTLLDDATSVVAELADEELAAAWRDRYEEWALVVEQPTGDHPSLAAAYRGKAAHLLSLDDSLQSPEAGVNLRGAMDVSVRSPDAFTTVFDPAGAYEHAFDEEYPGPDRDPRD